ncbi:MAG: ImmA/IrrE family metallo-endopeptidase [Defluviitaleaceae bacterium]|nr:ImmA/IrrE family metallo-endopeptidase [Defluviitaleaceae bacterium]
MTMANSSKILDKKSAAEKAIELYEQFFNIDEALDSSQFITDLDKIIEALGIKLLEGNLNDIFADDPEVDTEEQIAGFLYKEASGYMIAVNDQDALTRQRFTVAHEIGHLVLNHLEGDEAHSIFRNGVTTTGTDPREIAANAFAAELLMPERLFKRGFFLSDDSSELAMRFAVSLEATHVRLRNLGMIW